MDGLEANLKGMLKLRRMDDEKFYAEVAFLVDRLSPENKDPADRKAAARRILLFFRIRVLAEKSVGVSSCGTYAAFNLMIQSLFEAGEYESPFELDISDSQSILLLEDESLGVWEEITSPIEAVEILSEAGKDESLLELDVITSSSMSAGSSSSITLRARAVDRSVLHLRHPPLQFSSRLAAMCGRLDERWLIEEEGAKTRENVASLRAKLTAQRRTQEERG